MSQRLPPEPQAFCVEPTWHWSKASQHPAQLLVLQVRSGSPMEQPAPPSSMRPSERVSARRGRTAFIMSRPIVADLLEQKSCHMGKGPIG
jgi:hypothetical protein